MEYIRLPFITNPYPQTGNYLTTGDGIVSLYGLYDTKNKFEFNVENLNDVTPIEDTSFRFILSIKKDKKDTNPKYFTSNLYYRDLKAAIIESNPYFVNFSFKDSYIVNFYVSDVIDIFKNNRISEVANGLAVVRNNFIVVNNASATSVQTEKPKNTFDSNTSMGIEKKSDTINKDISDKQQKIQNLKYSISNPNFDYENGKRTFFGIGRLKIETPDVVYTADSDISLANREAQQTNIIQKINTDITQLESEVRDLQQQSKIAKEELNTKLLNSTPSNTKNFEFLGEDISIDYEKLVKYIDWIISSPQIAESDNNGVIPASELIQFLNEDEIKVVTGGGEASITTTTTTAAPIAKRYYSYQIVRMSIPNVEGQDTMNYIDTIGNTQTISQSSYGNVGTFCMEENSWTGAYNLYQITQIGKCLPDDIVIVKNPPNTGGGGGNYGGGGGGGSRGGGRGNPVNNDEWWKYPGNGMDNVEQQQNLQ